MAKLTVSALQIKTLEYELELKVNKQICVAL